MDARHASASFKDSLGILFALCLDSHWVSMALLIAQRLMQDCEQLQCLARDSPRRSFIRAHTSALQKRLLKMAGRFFLDTSQISTRRRGASHREIELWRGFQKGESLFKPKENTDPP